MIKLIHSEKVTPTESHFEIEINNKVIQFAKWVDMDWCTDYEIFKGMEALTQDEHDDVIDFIDEQTI
jgi:hypothetical protein